MSKVEDISVQSVTQVRGKWDYLKKRLVRRGVVEVNEQHPHFHMLCAMKMGIKTLLTDYPEARCKEILTEEDYEHIIKFTVTPIKGKEYTFESYASPVFACLRAAVDVDQEDYLYNLAPEDKLYLEFISNSRSGQHFYFSHTQRFILKTDKEHCIQHFLSILRLWDTIDNMDSWFCHPLSEDKLGFYVSVAARPGSYINHFLTYPHSLLVKFVGLYSIKGPSLRKKKYFLVMQSVFYPTVRLHQRYDIKGCLYNRYENPNPPGKKTILVLKDKNFLQEKIDLGPQKEWFITQLRADVDYLLSLRVLDYSILLGKHELQKAETKQSFGNLVVRLKKSVGMTSVDVEDNDAKAGNQPADETSSLSSPGARPKSYDATSITQVNPEGTPLAFSSATKMTNHSVDMNAQEMRVKFSKQDNTQSSDNAPISSSDPSSNQFLKSLSNKDYLDSTGMNFQNRRLLANCDNALHIIDGPQLRYYIGVIDFFTLFQCRQRVGKLFKDLKTCCGNHSTETPDVYARKFFDFISERVV